MSNKNLREARRAKKQRKKIYSSLIWSTAVIIILGFFGYLIWGQRRPAAPALGETIPIMPNYLTHVGEGQDPGPYNSNPPTSGPHYDSEYDAGFYNETSLEAQAPYPEGYLGHNLEHGYVIYWYNCDLLDTSECSDLKVQIQDSMEDNGRTKLIAFPRASLDVPVAMTTWGQLLKMDKFDSSQAMNFVSANRNQAPEPNAP